MLWRKSRCSRLVLSCCILTVAFSVANATPGDTMDPNAEQQFLLSHKLHSRRNKRSRASHVRGARRKQRRNQWLGEEEDSSDDALSIFVNDVGVLRKRPRDDDDVVWYSQDDPAAYYRERPRGPKLTAPPQYGTDQNNDCSNSQMVNSLLKGITYDCGCTNADQRDAMIRGSKKCLSTSSATSKSNKKSGKKSKGKQKVKGQQKGCSYAQKVKQLAIGEISDEDCGCSNTERVNNLVHGGKLCDTKSPPIKSIKNSKSYNKTKEKGSGKNKHKKGSRKSNKGKHMKFDKWKWIKGEAGKDEKKSGIFNPFERRRRPKPVIGNTRPTILPTAAPSISSAPSSLPSSAPTQIPTGTPSKAPIGTPSTGPTIAPTAQPSLAPSLLPSIYPTLSPTLLPSSNPTAAPISPTISPTTSPTQSPSRRPSQIPTIGPTKRPSVSPTGSPTSSPSRPPTQAPTTPSPTAAPSTAPPIPNPGCLPTIGLGDCLSTEDQLARTLPLATKGSVIGVCGSPDPISIGERLRIMEGGVTFCCADAAKPCILQSTGNDIILETQGGKIDILDLTFRNGTNPDPEGEGGNVLIQGFGDPHLIVGCTFEGGQGGSGGNVFIKTTGKVQITGSSFIDGSASTIGGGLAVEGATQLLIDGSDPMEGPTVFRGNVAGTAGGALFTTRIDVSSDSGQIIEIKGVVFDSNAANVGGAVAVSELGYLPTLTVLETNFTNNMARESGGAGAFLEIIDDISISFENNAGSGNTADTGTCPDFLAFDGSTGNEICISVNENFP